MGYVSQIMGLRSLESVARMLTSQYGINVKVGDPRTDGKTIYLPFYDLKIFDAPYPRKIHGYLDHESDHVIFSDTRAFVTFAKSGQDPTGVITKFWNIWEDGFIERKGVERFPGSAENLEESNRFLIETVIAPQKGQNLVIDFLNYICYVNKGYDLSEMMYPQLKTLVDLFEDISAEAKKVANSMDCKALAYKSFERLKDLVDQLPPMQPPDMGGQGDDSEDGSDKLENSQGDGKSGDKKENDKLGAGSGSEGPQDNPLAKKIQVAAEATGKDTNMRELNRCIKTNSRMFDLPPEFGEELKKALGDMLNQMDAALGHDSDSRDEPFSVLKDKLVAVKMKNPLRYADLFKKVSDDCRVLRPKFMSSVKGQSESYLEGNKKKGPKLDKSNLAPFVVGSTDRPFAKWKEDITEEVAVMVMLDESSSMNSTTSTQVMISITEPLSCTEAKVMVASFCSDAGKTKVRVYKTFDERFEYTKFRFGSTAATGGTPMPQGLDFCFMALSQRKEKRKMLIFITDGDPDGGQTGQDRVAKRVRAIESRGVEVVGVFLASDYYNHQGFKSMFPKNTIIRVSNGASMNLATALVTMLNKYFRPYVFKPSYLTEE